MDRSEPDHLNQDRLERKLREVLRRKKPSHDFDARVASRVARKPRRDPWWSSISFWPQLRWVAVTTLCLLLLGGIAYQREQQLERARGEAAKQQVMVALRIAGAKIKLARTKVQNLSER